jgi:putative DNA primase/helicase
MRPGILGALLDVVSAALRRVATVQVAPLPRMADFAKWGTAAAPALGWDAQSFLDAYAQNRADANAVALDDSAVAQAVHALASAVGHWEGTATGLLETLKARAAESRQSLRDWPRNDRGLSAVLRRMAPNLRAVGVAVTFARSGDKLRTRRIVIRGEEPGKALP